MKAAVVMIAYGLALLSIGYVTYSVAPPGANAWTALLITLVGAGLMIACAVLTLRIRQNRLPGIIGVHAGLVLPLLLAIGPAMRLSGSLENAAKFNDAVKAGSVTVVTQTGENKNTIPHPVAYQAVGLASIAVLSIFAFIALLMLRPPLPPRTIEAAASPAPEA
ncbi:MAG: hypothetical protein IBJ11_01355 [Phycisphaerales bacterium]|nr:hypothetical protein [Phycisphaerales bacterium]